MQQERGGAAKTPTVATLLAHVVDGAEPQVLAKHLVRLAVVVADRPDRTCKIVIDGFARANARFQRVHQSL